ncbi:MAG: hypothetical protein Q4C06_07110 [Bacillota bacterium]|nr:hypothetical protein [Bacillota bacterium]
MLITTIDQSNRAVFENMIETEIAASLDMQGYYAMGAIREDEKGKTAAGVLVFEITEGFDGTENIIGANLKWLYVAEESRQKGAADALMEELLRVLEEAEVEFLRCDLPMGEEYNLLCAYLEAWGMHFKHLDSYECSVSLKEIMKNPFFKQKTQRKVISLREFQPNALIKSIDQFQKVNLIQENLEEALSGCDMDVSCGIWEKDSIKGVLLAYKRGENELELLAIRSLKGSAEQVISLLLYAAEQAVEKYSDELMIRIKCRTIAAGELIAYFLPDVQPLMVRRGALLLGMTAEEAEKLWEEERSMEV